MRFRIDWWLADEQAVSFFLLCQVWLDITILVTEGNLTNLADCMGTLLAVCMICVGSWDTSQSLLTPISARTNSRPSLPFWAAETNGNLEPSTCCWCILWPWSGRPIIVIMIGSFVLFLHTENRNCSVYKSNHQYYQVLPILSSTTRNFSTVEYVYTIVQPSKLFGIREHCHLIVLKENIKFDLSIPDICSDKKGARVARVAWGPESLKAWSYLFNITEPWTTTHKQVHKW